MNNGMFKEYKFPTPCGEKCFITDIYKNTRHCKSVSVPLWGAMFHNDAVSTYKPVVLFPSPYGENYSLTLLEYVYEKANEFPSPYGENYSLTLPSESRIKTSS